MILYVMLVALGFLIAMLFALLLAPAFWRRAERLTARRLEQNMPMSIAEADAGRDQIRASYAIIIRRLEAALSQEKMRSARQLVKISRLQMEIADLNDKTHQLRGQLEAEHNAASVLRRTIATRVPELNRSAQDAKQLVHVRDREIDTIVNRLRHREEALAIAQRTTEMQQAEIARLRQAMEMSGSQNAGRFKLRPTEWTIHDYRAEYDRLNVELSKLRERLAVAYDREANQIKELRTELQQLADQVVTAAAALPEGEPQRAIANDTDQDGEPRRLSAPGQAFDEQMRSIDAIIGDAAGSARAPAVRDGSITALQAERSGGALARVAAAPKRLARGALQKMAGLAGATRDAVSAGSGRARDQGAAPAPGEVSAAKLLGGAAVSGSNPEAKRASGSGASDAASAREPASLPREATAAKPSEVTPETAKATHPGDDAADTATGDRAAEANARDALETPQPAAKAAPEAKPSETADAEDDASLYDSYRSAKPTSGKLMAGKDKADNAASDSQQTGQATVEAATGQAAAKPGAKPASSSNGAAALDAPQRDEPGDDEADRGSLLDRLKHVPESETR